jgi:restriction endonuclease S subunit
MNKYSLKDIAKSLRSGYQFREQIQSKPEGKFQVIQMKDINNDNSLSSEAGFIRVDIDLHDKGLLIENGDILFRARGNNNFASVVKGINDKTIAPAYFFIIKVNEKKVIPEYAAWYINQKPVQSYLKTNATGSNVPLINKKVLEELELVIPDMETQKKVVEIYTLSLKEIRLLEDIKNRKKVFTEALLLRLLDGTLSLKN